MDVGRVRGMVVKLAKKRSWNVRRIYRAKTTGSWYVEVSRSNPDGSTEEHIIRISDHPPKRGKSKSPAVSFHPGCAIHPSRKNLLELLR